MSAVAERVIAAFESLSADEKKAVATEIFRRFERLSLSQAADHKSRQPRRSALPESELATMAADPEIQREVRHINSEFSMAEPDGLENA